MITKTWSTVVDDDDDNSFYEKAQDDVEEMESEEVENSSVGNMALRKVGTQYKDISESDIYDFIMYKLRQNDTDFILDFFEGDYFLGPSIQKAYKQVFKGTFSFREIMDELYVYLAYDNWSRLDGFRGDCCLVLWIRTIAKNFFINYKWKDGERKKEVFMMDSPYATIEAQNRLIGQISSVDYKKILFYKYVQRLNDEETLVYMKIDKKKYKRLLSDALAAAKKVAMQDEYFKAIFIEEQTLSTEFLSIDVCGGYMRELSVEPTWAYTLTVAEMKTLVRNIIGHWKSENYKKVIELRLLQGKSVWETALQMGVSEIKIYNYFNVAYAKLSEEVNKNRNKIL